MRTARLIAPVRILRVYFLFTLHSVTARLVTAFSKDMFTQTRRNKKEIEVLDQWLVLQRVLSVCLRNSPCGETSITLMSPELQHADMLQLDEETQDCHYLYC